MDLNVCLQSRSHTQKFKLVSSFLNKRILFFRLLILLSVLLLQAIRIPKTDGVSWVVHLNLIYIAIFIWTLAHWKLFQSVTWVVGVVSNEILWWKCFSFSYCRSFLLTCFFKLSAICISRCSTRVAFVQSLLTNWWILNLKVDSVFCRWCFILLLLQ